MVGWLAKSEVFRLEHSYANLACIKRDECGGEDFGELVALILLARCERVTMSTVPPIFSLPQCALKAANGIGSLRIEPRGVIFRQGFAADSFFYLLSGRVQLSVVSEQGKEAIIAILEPDEVFGESCLLGFPTRRMTALALEESRVIRITREAALRLIAEDVGFDNFLVSHLLKSGIRTQEQLLDQFFNSSEKRLARTLLMLTNFAMSSEDEISIPKVSQETLAEMIGSTRPRINQFMNKFRKLGYIDYDGCSITVHRSLLSLLLYDAAQEADDSFLTKNGS